MNGETAVVNSEEGSYNETEVIDDYTLESAIAAASNGVSIVH